jgi:hypothetical protein
MKRALILAGCIMCFMGCTRYVKGTTLDIGIKRAPACKVTVKVDGALVLEAKAKKPCPKG